VKRNSSLYKQWPYFRIQDRTFARGIFCKGYNLELFRALDNSLVIENHFKRVCQNPSDRIRVIKLQEVQVPDTDLQVRVEDIIQKCCGVR
jgi:hypothetical protein